MSPGVSAEDGGTTVLGKEVSDLQTGLTIGTNTITGTLKYNEGWESGPLEGPGYYMALKFTATNWNSYDSVRVGLDPSEGTGLVEILSNPDKNGVFKITDKSTQKFVVEACKGAVTSRKQWKLDDLVLEDPVGSQASIPEDSETFQGTTTISDIENLKIIATDTENEYTFEGTINKIDTISGTNPKPKGEKTYYLGLAIPKTGFSTGILYGKKIDQIINLGQAGFETNGACKLADASKTDYKLIRYMFKGDLSVFGNFEYVYIDLVPSSGSEYVEEKYYITEDLFEN